MVADRTAPAWLTQTTYTHRGLHSSGIPENSLAAAEAAIANGFGIECDVQRSLDDEAMVFHDWELGRLTGASGAVEARSAEEIEKLYLLGTGEGPVRLETFLEYVAGQVPLLIEIKSKPDYDVAPSCVRVAECLADVPGNIAVMSFDPRVPDWFSEHSPAICRGLVGTDSYPNGFETMWRSADTLERAQTDFLALDRRDLGRPEAAALRSTGLPLLSWTIRSAEERTEALRRADALIAEGEALA